MENEERDPEKERRSLRNVQRTEVSIKSEGVPA
jgi:hypothetical protein